MQNNYLYLAALISGFMGSAHCFGMCGGLISVLSLNFKSDEQNARRKQFLHSIAYNVARIFSYSMVGLIAGLFSFTLTRQLPVSFFHVLQIIASVILLGIALNILGWRANLLFPEKITSRLWLYLQKLARSILPIDSILKSFLLGLVWGWIPCGLVYSVLLIALTKGQPVEAALIMFVFGLGTLPAMFVLSYFSNYSKRFFQHPLLRYVSASILIVIAVMPFVSHSLHKHHDSEVKPGTHEHHMNHH